MRQFSFGFVYILANETMPGIVKIGQTSRLSEDRAIDLFTTGVPQPFEVYFRALTSNPKDLEKEIHEQLKDLRVNSRREFFRVTPEQAINTILEARQKIDGIENYCNRKPPIHLCAGDRMLLSMRSGQIFVVSAYQNFFSPEPDVVDCWQAHTDGDTLEIYCVEESEYTSGLSDNESLALEDPVPFLDRKNSINNGIIIGKERLVPGDRILWMCDNSGEGLKSVVFEANSHCQVIARTNTPKYGDATFPLLLNDMNRQCLPQPMITAGQVFLRLPPPRAWAPRNPNSDETWSKVAVKSADPEFWLSQLTKRNSRK
jgi:hypothetical protein